MNDRKFPVQAMPSRRRRMLRQPNLAMLHHWWMLPLPRRRRRMLRQPNSASPIILPDELIVEILSWLPVKPLMKFKCVSKFLKTIISDPHFVQMHLKKSSRNSHLTLILQHDLKYRDLDYFSIPGLLQKKITIIHDSPFRRLNDYLIIRKVVGSCNGLLCLIAHSTDQSECLCFWNPAMRTTSKISSIFSDAYRLRDYRLKHSFGYDNLTGIYKVVAFYVYNPKSVVKVLNMGDNYFWRDIQCFLVLPLYWFHREKNNGVYFNGTINWLALRNYFRSSYESDWFKGINVEQYVIVSLDLSTESYTQMLLPCGFDEVPHVQPIVAVLVNSICFGHDFQKKHFVIWHMKDFGVQESWVRLFKFDYHNFYSSNYSGKYLFQFQPLYLYENGQTLIFSKTGSTFIYNCIDNGIEQIKTRVTPLTFWFWGKDYFESLVPTY